MTTTQIDSREFWKAEKAAKRIFGALDNEQVVHVEYRDPVDGRIEPIKTYHRSDFPEVPPSVFRPIDQAEESDDNAIVSVKRLITYEGPREWVEGTLSKSLTEGENKMANKKFIRIETLNKDAVTA